MIVQPGLLRILWRTALPATLFGVAGLGGYALLWPDVMTAQDGWPALLVFVQSLLLALLLGRFATPAFAFVYSRGCTRDSLWGHTMLVSGLSIIAAWLPAALIVWTGIRSVVHDRVFQSPCFPILAPFETWAPLAWLALSLVLTSAFHYAWIRCAQPTKGPFGGFVVAIAAVVVLLMRPSVFSYFYGWFAWVSGAACVLTVLCLVIGGRALHRSLEVRA
jgi:hypothetical protein